MYETWAAGGGLGLIFVLAGLLVRVLLKTDNRWARIVDEQAETISALKRQCDEAEADRDRWRERYMDCLGHASADYGET